MQTKTHTFLRLSLSILVSAVLFSCSTTRTLESDQLRLDSNEIIIVNDKDFPAASLQNYIRQKPNNNILGLKPMLYIYNWSDGSDKGLNKFWKIMGEAPVVYDPAQVELSKNSIKNHLENLGYYDSNVEGELKLKGQVAKVRYYVTLGERYKIDSIIFSLPSRRKEFESDFYSDITEMKIHAGDYLSEQSLDAEVQRSLASLREKGYFALNMNCYSFVADTLGKNGYATLEYIISEDERPLKKAKIGEVNISFPENLNVKEDVLKGVNLIMPGETYSESVVSNTYNRFSSLKIFKTVGIDMSAVSDDKVNCDIILSKSQQQGFKTNLEFSTNSSGLIGISPQLSFYHKNLFKGGEWLNIGFVGNFQFKPNDNISSEEFGTSLSLSLPRLLGVDNKHIKGPNIPRTEFNLAFNYQNRPEYTRNIMSTSFGVSGIIRGRFYYQLYPLQLNYVRLFNLNEDFMKKLEKNPFMKYSYQDHCDLGLGTSLFYNSSTDLVPKTDYHSFKLSFDLSGNVLSLFKGLMKVNSSGEALVFGAPFSQYARIEASLAKGIRFGANDSETLAFRLLAGAGLAYGNSTAMPYEKQFYCGGAGSMRAWQARALGPGASKMDETFSIPSQTGDIKLEADIEYRFPLIWKVEGALFAEVGNVWKGEKGVKLDELAADWGLGLRINLDFLVLRIDWGIRLRDPSLDGDKWLDPITALKMRGSAICFGVGYPF
ncbi:MAG: BamA/TamA family outer membrane protein [Candidatus Cryptobacteroides sp.]